MFRKVDTVVTVKDNLYWNFFCAQAALTPANVLMLM